MTTLVVHPCERPLLGSVPVPPDDAIGHSALLVAALSEGAARVGGIGRGRDVAATQACLRALGVAIDEVAPGELLVRGAGPDAWRAQEGPIDCGSSDATLLLLAAVLAGRPSPTTLVGGTEAGRETISRVVGALRARGASIDFGTASGADGARVPSLTVGGLGAGLRLGALEHESLEARPSLKGAVLLSGLFASGVTRFREPTVSPDHVERRLAARGAPIRTVGPMVELDPSRWDGRLSASPAHVPGDVSAAALLIAAAQLVPGSRVSARGVGVNPTRAGLLEILRDMGAGLAVEPQGERDAEPVAILHGWSSRLHGVVAGGETLTRAAVDLPLLCAVAARAAGVTRVRGALDLRDASRDAVTAMVPVLRAFGVECHGDPDGIDIVGSDAPAAPATVDAGGDPDVAMAAAVLGLVSAGPARIAGADGIAGRYPKFVATLRALGARIDVER
jgi:3-phosphoshikimate 1-carboxyvinyltransferase